MKKSHQAIITATWVGIIVNVFLTVIKAVGGILSGSRALIADALHSASDIVGSVVVLFAVRIASKPPDKEHPYGHGKAENIASIIIALLLIIVGVEIVISSGKVFFGEQPTAPGKLALVILIISIIIKEVLFQYKHFLGSKYSSNALISEAWHHRSDALSSLAALAGVGLALLGAHYDIAWLVYGDAIAGIVVSIIVIKVGYELARDASNIMLEQVLNDEAIEKYEQTVHTVGGVKAIDELLARTHGQYVIIDIKVAVNALITVQAGHDIAAQVKRALITEHPEVEDVLVHINPYIDQ